MVAAPPAVGVLAVGVVAEASARVVGALQAGVPHASRALRVVVPHASRVLRGVVLHASRALQVGVLPSSMVPLGGMVLPVRHVPILAQNNNQIEVRSGCKLSCYRLVPKGKGQYKTCERGMIGYSLDSPFLVIERIFHSVE